MKRKTKFRAWWKEAKLMVRIEALRNNGSIEFFVDSRHGEVIEVIEEILQVLDESEQYELMQFTGLLDKNGKEIFEGDVLEVVDKDTGKHYSEVHEGSLIKPFVVEWKNHGYNFGYGFKDTALEIIGNIYENPNLLNP